ILLAGGPTQPRRDAHYSRAAAHHRSDSSVHKQPMQNPQGVTVITFLLRRLVSAAVLLVVISFVAYMLLYPAAGDIARNVLGENASEEQVAILNAKLGLDQPLLVQYFNWFIHAVTGDLGRSYFTSQSVWDSLMIRTPVTLSLV